MRRVVVTDKFNCIDIVYINLFDLYKRINFTRRISRQRRGNLVSLMILRLTILLLLASVLSIQSAVSFWIREIGMQEVRSTKNQLFMYPKTIYLLSPITSPESISIAVKKLSDMSMIKKKSIKVSKQIHSIGVTSSKAILQGTVTARNMIMISMLTFHIVFQRACGWITQKGRLSFTNCSSIMKLRLSLFSFSRCSSSFYPWVTDF